MEHGRKISGEILTGERALFQGKDLHVAGCTFRDGESPLKESKNIALENCTFGWKYPLWYAERVTATDCFWQETGRAGVWYSNDVRAENCIIEAPKTFRRCRGLSLINVSMPNAQETLWECADVHMCNVRAKGDYLGMNCANVTVENLTLEGNYCFDGAKNVVVRNSRLLSKDAFWNSENVTVYDSYISGEYFAWNAKNLTLVNCTVESLQGFCYIENLTLVNCRLPNTTLSFEYCKNIDATVLGSVDSVKNPISGRIAADAIGELVWEADKVDRGRTEIVIGGCKRAV